jgi:hypothetical protein
MDNHALPGRHPSSESSGPFRSGPNALPRYIKELVTIVAAILAVVWAVKSHNTAKLSNELTTRANSDAAAQAVLSNQLMLVSMCQANADSVCKPHFLSIPFQKLVEQKNPGTGGGTDGPENKS